MKICIIECEINTAHATTQLFLHNIPYKNRAKILKNTNREANFP